MPGFATAVDAPTGRKAIARATLRVPGTWPQDLDDEQKVAWRAATRAIDALLALYVPPDWTCTGQECIRVNEYTNLFCARCGSLRADQP